MKRRATWFILLLWFPIVGRADDVRGLDSSIQRGLSFLASQRNRDGSFGTGDDRLISTSRAMLVFLQTGNVPDLGKFGLAVRDAEEWLLTSALPNGGFSGSDNRTSSQAVAVLALAETYGVETNPERRSRLSRTLRSEAASLSVGQVAQSAGANAEEGAWPDERGASVSLQSTAIALIALSAARDCGIEVPTQVVDRGRAFILRCRDKARTGFGRSPQAEPTLESTAAALFTLDLISTPVTEVDRTISDCAKFLESEAPLPRTLGFVGGAWVGWCDARLAIDPIAKIRDTYVEGLVASQDKDGAWNGTLKGGSVKASQLAATELSLIAISSRLRTLPILRH